jgi:N-acetylneuraminic acid mutarotase
VVTEGADSLVVGGYDGLRVPRPLLSVGPAGHSHRAGRLVRGVRYAATAQLGHTVFVFGGEVDHQELDAVQAVDVSSGRTRVVGRLPVPLGHAMAASVGDRILLVGGRVSPNAQTAAMWLYDPASGSFRKVGRLPRPLSDAGVATDGGKVWLLGGEQPQVTDRVVRLRVH